MSLRKNISVNKILQDLKLSLFIVGSPNAIINLRIDARGIRQFGSIGTRNCKAGVIRGKTLVTVESDRICQYRISNASHAMKADLIGTVAVDNFLCHDAVLAGDILSLVNTNYSCLSKLNLVSGELKHFFKPSFITKIIGEDRTHINGCAWSVEKDALYISALGKTNKHRAWKDSLSDGGILIDVKSGKVILSKLNMPHSPRMYRGHLYFLTSGDGKLNRYNIKTSVLETVLTMPYFVRGLLIYRQYAFIGISTPRYTVGTPDQANAYSGVAVVDMSDGRLVGTIKLPKTIKEVYNIYAFTKNT